jgi:GT2 family glycosyltransferase
MVVTKKYPLVSIVSINYNHSDVTLLMIKSLKKCSYKNIEIIIVDNASFNDTPEVITEKYPDVKLVLLPHNLGFGGGNNEGIKLAKGDYILLLNNDTELDSGFLEPMVDIFSNFPDVGMVSPKLLFLNSLNMKTIQYAGARNISLYTGRGSNIGWGEIDNGQYDEIYKTDYAHGAALLFSRKVLEIVGCMPDLYFLYYEEHDWCHVMHTKGLSSYFCGNSKVYHKESVSVGKNSPIKAYFMPRNRIIYLRRNGNWFTFLFAILFFLTISTPVAIIKMLKNKESHLIKYYFSGIFWNLTHLKSLYGFPKLINNDAGHIEILLNELEFNKHSMFVKSVLNTEK